MSGARKSVSVWIAVAAFAVAWAAWEASRVAEAGGAARTTPFYLHTKHGLSR